MAEEEEEEEQEQEHENKRIRPRERALGQKTLSSGICTTKMDIKKVFSIHLS